MALTSVEREPGELRSAGTGLRCILLLVLVVTLMVLDHRNQHLVEVRKDLAAMLHPVQLLVSAPANISRQLSESIDSRNNLIEENRRLKQEALALKARMLRMTALEAENARLLALLDSTKKVGDDSLIAEILSVDLNPFRNMILINRGSNDGAYIGQAVIDADGIIGQIIRDRRVSSEAMLITDVDHAIPVELVRNRLRTIAVGTGKLNRLSLPYLPVSADIRDGDLLITSGLGGKFPPGYPVGTVRSVRSVTGLPFLAVDAEPAAALNRIREVLLITPPEPEAISTAENAPPVEGDSTENPATATPGSETGAVMTGEPSPAGAPAAAGTELPVGDALENSGEQLPAASNNATMPVEDTE